jgi:hypothetical protein
MPARGAADEGGRSLLSTETGVNILKDSGLDGAGEQAVRHRTAPTSRILTGAPAGPGIGTNTAEQALLEAPDGCQHRLEMAALPLLV